MQNPSTVLVIGGLLLVVYSVNMGFLQSIWHGLAGTCETECKAAAG